MASSFNDTASDMAQSSAIVAASTIDVLLPDKAAKMSQKRRASTSSAEPSPPKKRKYPKMIPRVMQNDSDIPEAQGLTQKQVDRVMEEVRDPDEFLNLILSPLDAAEKFNHMPRFTDNDYPFPEARGLTQEEVDDIKKEATDHFVYVVCAGVENIEDIEVAIQKDFAAYFRGLLRVAQERVKEEDEAESANDVIESKDGDEVIDANTAEGCGNTEGDVA